MVKFFETLKDFITYDEEVFPCELVVSSSCDLARPGNVEKILSLVNILTLTTCQQQGWSLSVELVIGGRGIRQRTQKNAAVSMLKI